jgi:5-methylthioadenosine/S-adenosylhomocysteine deaminase
MQADLLLHADWIIPVDAENRVLEHHSLAIKHGRICAILPNARAKVEIQATEQHELAGHALIPGLINSHTHAAMSLLRGRADDLPLMTWLHDYIWPTEARWMGEEFVHDGTQLALLEMLRGGTTCFNDMYFFPEVTARAVTAAGMRASLGLIVIDFPSAWARDADEYLHKGLRVHDQFRQHPLIRTAFAPHAPYSISDGPLQQIATLAEELDIPVHMHVHETRDEIRQSLRDHGERPLARLEKLGLLGPHLIAVHATQLEPEEVQQLALHGAHIAHCPESNMKLASGICPVAGALLPAGVNCALGTDGAASNNDLDMLGEMRSAALLGKIAVGKAAALPAHQALRMATINGAKALGMEQEIGSLEIGKAADIVAVDLDRPETQPIYHPLSQLVYASSREQVRHVWIAGKQVLKGREALTLDSAAILRKSHRWRERITGV